MTEYEIKRLCDRVKELWKEKEQLKAQITDIKANCDLAIEGRDVKIKELEKQVKDLEWQLQEVVKDNDNYQAENKRLEQQTEKMKKYIKACWIEENLNDYSSYITNTSDEFRDFVKELNEEIRNGR